MKGRIKILLSSGALALLGYGQAIAQTASPELLVQAKKEGRVTWYTTVSIPESKQFMDIFEKQYPFIKVDLLRSGSGPLVNRIVSEYAAKNYAADILRGMSSRGGFTALRQRNIIGRYDSPEQKYYSADLKDKDGYWSSTFQNIKGFKRVVQDVESESMAESIKLFQQTFNLAPG